MIISLYIMRYLIAQVLRSRCSWSLRSNVCLTSQHEQQSTGITYPGHSTVNDKIGTIDKAALVASQEDHGMGLLNGLTEPSGREVDLATEPLGLIVAEPVLEKRSAT